MKQEVPSTPQTQTQNNNVPKQDQKKKKMKDQDYKKEATENKERWMPFIKFMKKLGFKLKTARCQKDRIEYFRTKDLRKLLQTNKQEIAKSPAIQELARVWQKQVIYFNRPLNIQKLKYPKVLQKSQLGPESNFASFKFDASQPKTWLFPAILIAVIAVVLFPLWPYVVKYAVFMISLVLLTVILSTIVLRLIAYLLGAIFGVSFWILPNLFENCTFAESFIPIYESKKWQKGIFNTIARILAFSIFVYYAYHVYIDSSWVYENMEITKSSFDELHDWGVSKIKGERNFSQSALTNLDIIMNQTADVHIDETIDLGNEQIQGSESAETSQGQFVDSDIHENEEAKENYDSETADEQQPETVHNDDKQL